MSPTSPEAGEPGVADALLAELEAGGELVGGQGRFTIDAAQARAKLRGYLLAEPEAFVLLLVEAAVLGGGVPVEIETTLTTVRVWLGPIHASRVELDQLFAAAFIELDGFDAAEVRRRRALQKLAFACNTAVGLSPPPHSIVIESVGGDEDLHLRLTPSDALGELSVIENVDGAKSGLSITIDRRNLADGQSRSIGLVRERCAYAPFAIELDGRRVDRGLRHALFVELDDDDTTLGFGASGRKVRPITLDGQTIGLAGFRYSGRAPAELTILTHGVFAEHLEFGDADRPAAPDFTAIVDVDLARDLSQSKILRGPAFDAIVDAVWTVHDAIAPANFGPPRSGPLEPTRRSAELGVIPLVLGLGGFVTLGVAAISGNDRTETIAWLLLGAAVASGLFIWINNQDRDVADELDQLDD